MHDCMPNADRAQLQLFHGLRMHLLCVTEGVRSRTILQNTLRRISAPEIPTLPAICPLPEISALASCQHPAHAS
jgi:hypothetical protein